MRVVAAAALAAAMLPAQQTNGSTRLTLTVGKSLVIDSPLKIQRVSVANGELVEAVAVSPREVLINGKAPGETTLIIWQDSGARLLYDLTVRLNPAKVDATRQQIAREIPDQDVTINFENDAVFVRGTVKDLVTAERVMAIASTLGKTVNLLRVTVPPPETQILLRVRFANVDRAASSELGVNIASAALNTTAAIGTGQFGRFTVVPDEDKNVFSFSDALNVFLFRRDLNLGATIKALENRRLLEVLAEPNVLAINGKQASFVAGGEFPFPTLQGGAAVGAVTVIFREFGVRINFLPTVTPRGTIRLQVAPEVSSLDYANGVTFQGFTIPALATRRVITEVELESGQSFVIAGLLDNRLVEAFNKVPGIGDIPVLGKLFQSRSASRNNTELMVLITPEVVRPIPQDQSLPAITMPQSFMEPNSPAYPRQPGMERTGPVPAKPPEDSVPVEQLMQEKQEGQAAPAAPQFQLVPLPMPAAPPQANPGVTPAPMPGASGSGGK
jgi:pilus assembly protein CpaC